ncbi:unnamed protein product [Arctia plantaginis]|uniref:DUF4219 domain-containing protein n=1 Tax=Arctia plantaginis TaxID=874455 RepID=A0A8S0YSQ9_ARCPL|nr:unnamed protein product [Arctia plantaginis]
MASETRVSILPKLTNENYANWKFRVQCLLEEKKLSEVTKTITVKERNKEDDAKARSLIVQCIPDRYLDIIKDSNTAGDMLKKLDEVFQRKSVFSKLHLRRKLLSLKLGDNKMEEYLYKF